MGGDLQQTQVQLREWFGAPTILVVMVVYLLLVIAKLNIMAKRIRDMGLSGWWIVLVIILATGLTSSLHNEQTGGFLFCVAWLMLLLIPSNTFGHK
jgi:uncharacterized membrane protein YhaH (DUF805 family)